MTDNIYQALNEVMKQVGYVQKQFKKGINYSYAGEAALIAAVRPHCVEHGIVIHPYEVKEVHQDRYTTKSGTNMNRALVVMVYRIAHAPSGTFIDVPVTGEGADVGDKTFNKALTGAYKYALRQTLMIETGDDPDKFPSEPQEAVDTKNGKAPEPAAASNGETNGKKLMAPAKFIQYIVDKLGYKNDSHVRATMGLIGFKTVPQDKGKRKLVYETLEAYRGLRDKGLSQDDALAALDGERDE